MYTPQIRIIKSDPKWTNFIYVASSARSRMLTEKVNNKVKRSELEIINAEALFPTGTPTTVT